MRRKRDKIFSTDLEDVESTFPGQNWGETVPTKVYGRVANSTYVNIREEPSRSSKSMGVLQRGAPVRILEELERYYKIEPMQPKLYSFGYISKDYCEVL